MTEFHTNDQNENDSNLKITTVLTIALILLPPVITATIITIGYIVNNR